MRNCDISRSIIDQPQELFRETSHAKESECAKGNWLGKEQSGGSDFCIQNSDRVNFREGGENKIASECFGCEGRTLQCCIGNGLSHIGPGINSKETVAE